MPYDLDRVRRQRVRPTPPSPTRPGLAAALGYVASDDAQISEDHFFNWNPAEILGNEVEGGSYTISHDASVTRQAVMLGNDLFSQGDMALVRFADYRWVADGKGKRKREKSCADIPSTITLSVSDNSGHTGHCPTMTQRSSGVWVSRNTFTSSDCYGILGNPPSPLGPVAGVFTFTCHGSTPTLQWDVGPPCYPSDPGVKICNTSTFNPYFNSLMVLDSASFDPLMVVFHGCIRGSDPVPTHLTWTISL
ncbi:hypothetical protein ACYOEI_05895 [Singulisphaera rosea]